MRIYKPVKLVNNVSNPKKGDFKCFKIKDLKMRKCCLHTYLPEQHFQAQKEL